MKRMMICILIFCLTFITASGSVFAGSKVKNTPELTKVTVCYDKIVKLSWNKVKFAVKYKVYRKQAGGNYVLVKTTKKQNWNDRKLSYGSQYTYKIKAVLKNKEIRTSRPKTVCTKPAKPVLSAKVCDADRALVTWNAAKGAVRYKVYRKKGEGNYVLVKMTSKTRFEDKDLDFSTRYMYRVKAVSRAGAVNVSTAKKIITGKWVLSPHLFAMGKQSGLFCVFQDFTEPEMPVIPEMPSVPDTPEESLQQPETEDTTDSAASDKTNDLQQPSQPDMPENPDLPSEPVIPDAPAEPDVPEEKTITIEIPVYTKQIVYWIKSVDTGEVLYQTMDPNAFELEILTRPDPDTWHWGSGGVQIITSYLTLTMTESEWMESLYYGREDVIVVTQEASSCCDC